MFSAHTVTYYQRLKLELGYRQDLKLLAPVPILGIVQNLEMLNIQHG